MSKSYCAVLCVLMLLGSEFRCFHGRCLKCRRHTRHLVKAHRMKAIGKILYADMGTNKVATQEHFRPTAPGPSPGAGHTIRN
ncbi:hypothetical protein HanIR_Chr15g0776341 [Helianthus annuus]|nr:hypothetical protein HanIR_Chr15g0776341 [Helianthus annuus]